DHTGHRGSRRRNSACCSTRPDHGVETFGIGSKSVRESVLVRASWSDSAASSSSRTRSSASAAARYQARHSSTVRGGELAIRTNDTTAPMRVLSTCRHSFAVARAAGRRPRNSAGLSLLRGAWFLERPEELRQQERLETVAADGDDLLLLRV